MVKILYGDVIAKELSEELKVKCDLLKPQMAVVIVGDDYGSLQYVKQIEKKAASLNVTVIRRDLPQTINQEDLEKEIVLLNQSEEIAGIIIQMPLPKHIDSQRIIEVLDPAKDLDGLHPYNLGRLFAGKPRLLPCTAAAVMRLLAYYEIPVAGKNVVIVGRSISVGKPLAALMINDHATVTICHSKSESLFEITKNADIIVCAIGRAKFFDEQYFDEKSIVIDVGINSDENGICGDVAYNQVESMVKAITPVPKGVGSLTIIALMENLIAASENK